MTSNRIAAAIPARTHQRGAKLQPGGDFYVSPESSSGDESLLPSILETHALPPPQAPSAAISTPPVEGRPLSEALEGGGLSEKGPEQVYGPDSQENPAEGRGLGVEMGTDDESCVGSVSVGFRDHESVGRIVGASYGHSISTSIESSNGSLKRWGVLRTLNKSKGGSSSQEMSTGSNPDPDTDEKENPGPFEIVLPTRHEAERDTASETVKALFRTLSDKEAAEPNQPSIPSPKSPPVPGFWINKTWGRKAVEDLDNDIIKGLNEVGIDTDEYFKRDHTTFPSIAHYYVNLHERLNDRPDEEVVDLLTSLENRIGVDNPLVKAMHEVMQHDDAPGANYSEALVVNVSIDNSGGSKVYVNYPHEETKLEPGAQCMREDDHDVDPESYSDRCSNKDSMHLDSDFIPMVPEMGHMRNELAGLSWVVKRPSRRQLSIPASHHQDDFSSVNLAHNLSNAANESISTITSTSVDVTTSASITFGALQIQELESDARMPSRDAQAVRDKPRAPQSRGNIFSCCFGRPREITR